MSDTMADSGTLPSSAATERMDLDNGKTERLEVPAAPKPKGNSFTGSLKQGEAVDGFTVEKLISAQTGEAEIYLAKKGNESAVVKYYHPQFQPKDDILSSLRGLRHEDIISVFAHGTYKGRFYEIMEYAAGGTLADRKEDGSWRYLPMKEENAVQIVRETINAFSFLHGKGIIHRDIKPGNLFYKNADGTDLLIGDFGISSELDVEGGMSKRMTANIARTDGYAAPELYGIARDDNKNKILIGPEVDYYALGITLFEIMTGTNPFEGRNALHIMRDTIEGRVADDLLTKPEAASISGRMQTLIRGLLIVRHDKRWGFGEVTRWLNGEEVELYRDTPALPALKFGDRSISSFTELASAIRENRTLGTKYLMRGLFDQWAVKFDESLANDIIEIKESENFSDDEKTSYLMFYFDPDLPCVLSGEQEISSFDEFVTLLRTEPEAMIEAVFDRTEPEFYPWVYMNLSNGDENEEDEKDFPEKLSEYAESVREAESDTARQIASLYVSLADSPVKPFRDDELELTDIDSLLTVGGEYRQKILDQLENPDSILFQWLEEKYPSAFSAEIWSSVLHEWDRLVSMLTGALVHFDGKYMTNAEKERLIRRKRKEKIFKTVSSHIAKLAENGKIDAARGRLRRQSLISVLALAVLCSIASAGYFFNSRSSSDRMAAMAIPQTAEFMNDWKEIYYSKSGTPIKTWNVRRGAFAIFEFENEINAYKYKNEKSLPKSMTVGRMYLDQPMTIAEYLSGAQEWIQVHIERKTFTINWDSGDRYRVGNRSEIEAPAPSDSSAAYRGFIKRSEIDEWKTPHAVQRWIDGRRSAVYYALFILAFPLFALLMLGIMLLFGTKNWGFIISLGLGVFCVAMIDSAVPYWLSLAMFAALLFVERIHFWKYVSSAEGKDFRKVDEAASFPRLSAKWPEGWKSLTIDFSSDLSFTGGVDTSGMRNGTLTSRGEYEYTGEFNGVHPHGTGKENEFDGTLYEGEFHKGLRHGRGKVTDQSGNLLREGTWANGMMTSNG